MTKKLSPEERKQILKRYRWSLNRISQELKLRGLSYSHMAVNNWITNKHFLKSPTVVIALTGILGADLDREGLEVTDMFNVKLND